MQVTSTKRDETLVIGVSGQLDAGTASEFDRALKELLPTPLGRVVLDCAELEYISSAGLRSVLKLAKDLAAADGELDACSLTGIVAEVFEISGFTHLVTVYGDLDEALAAG